MEIKSCAGKKRRKDGRYAGYAYADGQPRQYVYHENLQEMKRMLAMLVDDIDKGIVKDSIKLVDYINRQWLEIYCKDLSPTTRNEYQRQAIRDIIPALGKKEIRKITFNDVQKMMNAYCETHSEKSSRSLLGIIKSIFNHAIRDKIREDNPCVGIKIKRTAPYEYDVYTVGEMEAYIDVAIDSIYAIPILLAALCGMRLSEICGLRWEDVNFETNEVSVRRAAVYVKGAVIIKVPKTPTSYRKFVAPQMVMDILRKSRGMKNAYVYPEADGSARNGNALSKRIKRFREKNGFAHTRFHDLRHFNATTMLENGISDKQAAANLGHANTNMTKKYQHILKSVADRPAQMMDKLFKKDDEAFGVKNGVKSNS